MRATILWSERARLDLLGISYFRARGKPQAAAKWAEKIFNAIERTAASPASGRIVPEIDRSDIREVIFENYPIIHQLSETGIVTMTVFESHRSLDETIPDPAEIPKRILAPHIGAKITVAPQLPSDRRSVGLVRPVSRCFDLVAASQRSELIQ